MQCPRVWSVPQPVDNQRFVKRELANAAADVLARHHFNHSVSVSVPDTSCVPDWLLASIAEDGDYYRIRNLRAHELVNKQFVEAFVKKGKLSLLAINRKLDVHSTLAVTPRGYLVLSLVKGDYQRLGLEGKPMKHKLLPRYVVKVNLHEESFAPGKKCYERVQSGLKEAFSDTFDVIVCWESPDEKICPSSVAAWFNNRGYGVSVCQQQCYQRSSNDIQFPTLDELNIGTEVDSQTSLVHFFDWYGYFSTGCDLSNDELIKLPFWPKPEKEKRGDVQYVQYSGFFTSDRLMRFIQAMKEYTTTQKDLSWCCIDIHSFTDCPTNFDLRDNIFYTPTSGNISVLLHAQSNQMIIRLREPTVSTKPKNKNKL